MKKKLIIIAVVLIVLGLVSGALYLYQIKTRNAVNELVANKKIINVLLSGVNSYKERKFDFFAILSLNPDNNNIGITFIPPSFKIQMGSSEKDIQRIDEVDFLYFDKMTQSISRDLKIQIPFYIELYATDGVRITDMLEGINIYYLDQQGCDKFAKPGLNYFNGHKLMQYINSVEQNSIYLKYDRIMDVILTLYYNNREDKIKFLKPEFVSELIYSLQTNLLPQELFSLSRFLSEEGEIFYTILPGDLRDNYYVTDDLALKMYENEFLKRLVVGTDGDITHKIMILNATSVTGLARKMRNVLNREGYNVVEFGTSNFGEMEKSMVISRKGDHAFVQKLSELTGIPTIHYIIDNSLLYNTLIIIGKDLASEEEVGN